MASSDGTVAYPGGGVAVTDPEQRLVAAIRAGDERVFAELVERHSPAMLRVALLHVPSRAVAEEVVQEAWLGVIEGIARFRGDASLRTWIFRILTNRAKTRGERERRTLPFSALAADGDEDTPSVDPERFLDSGHLAGHWANPPRNWEGAPEERLVSGETQQLVRQAIDELPPRQRTVIMLRDVHDWTAEEVREALELSEGNQRVLLHRARTAVRHALERYLAVA